MTTTERITEFRRRLRNTKARLARTCGVDGASELRRRELRGVVELLESGIATYQTILRSERCD